MTFNHNCGYFNKGKRMKKYISLLAWFCVMMIAACSNYVESEPSTGEVQQALTTIGGPCNTNGSCSGSQKCINPSGSNAYCSIKCSDDGVCADNWAAPAAQTTCYDLHPGPNKEKLWCVKQIDAPCSHSNECAVSSYCEDLDGDGTLDHCRASQGTSDGRCHGNGAIETDITCSHPYHLCCNRQDGGANHGDAYCDHTGHFGGNYCKLFSTDDIGPLYAYPYP